MNTNKTIPIVVGVTGHRAIREQDITAIKNADLLCADTAEELGIPVVAVLPMDRAQFEEDFSEKGRERLYHHCSRAEDLFVAPQTEMVPATGISRDYLFRQAGIYIASHSHVLLALWDGGPGTEAACGTSETVDFALSGSYAPASGVAMRSAGNESVIHVFTPRGERTGKAAGTVDILGDTASVKKLLAKTDEFNALMADMPEEAGSRLPDGVEKDTVLERMEMVSIAAGRLSRDAARVYRRILALLAVASALLTFAFLMYDEAQAIWMILVCGFMLLGAWLCRKHATSTDCHRKYIEYRALAECLRVETYLHYAGSAVRASENLSWTQQDEMSWIMTALCVLEIGEQPKGKHDICKCWVEEQLHYHQNAGRHSKKALDSSERVVRFALILSIGLYLAAVLFELFCGGLVFKPSVQVQNVDLYRTVLKILLGTISAVTLFVANYYGRLSLQRSFSDHGKMERFYAKMGDQLLRRGQTDELLRVLAREELIENGNWCSYQQDNTPDISI